MKSSVFGKILKLELLSKLLCLSQLHIQRSLLYKIQLLAFELVSVSVRLHWVDLRYQLHHRPP